MVEDLVGLSVDTWGTAPGSKHQPGDVSPSRLRSLRPRRPPYAEIAVQDMLGARRLPGHRGPYLLPTSPEGL
eukprot:19321-Alexandrium_andersonii.AAC.1